MASELTEFNHLLPMLKFVAQIATALSPAWLSVHLFLLQGGYREEIFDEFLRSREFDQAMGAAFIFLQTFLIPLFAVTVSFAHWQKEKNKAALSLFLTAALTALIGLILYFALPSQQDAIERHILEHLKAPQSQN